MSCVAERRRCHPADASDASLLILSRMAIVNKKIQIFVSLLAAFDNMSFYKGKWLINKRWLRFFAMKVVFTAGTRPLIDQLLTFPEGQGRELWHFLRTF